MSGIALTEVDTPAFIVDLPRLRANIERVSQSAAEAELEVRPHIKAHKTPEIARMQIAAGAAGVTAAKVGEAEAMIDAGIADVFIANEIVGEQKLRRLARLFERGYLSVACDSTAVARGYSEVFADEGLSLDVVVEVDIGAHRCGVPPEKAGELADAIAELPSLNVVGVMGYASVAYLAKTDQEREAAAAREGKLLADVADDLRSRGHEVRRISGGCTPTATSYRKGCGLTEIRSGTYVFYDMNQVDMGVVTPEDVSATILATVISKPEPGRAILDAGSKAVATQVKQVSPGFGWVKGNAGAYLNQLNDEHGYLDLAEAERDVEIGEKIEIIPPRVCTALNLYDELYLVEDGRVTDVCRVTARGKNQ
jgi:D-serine deaminase-like pyridoxal phosphate-dependent protein